MKSQLDLSHIESIVAEHGTQRDAVIPILQAIQHQYRYLPKSALQRVCQLTEITPADITGVSTFYTHFRHQPVGTHTVHVCHPSDPLPKASRDEFIAATYGPYHRSWSDPRLCDFSPQP